MTDQDECELSPPHPRKKKIQAPNYYFPRQLTSIGSTNANEALGISFVQAGSSSGGGGSALTTLSTFHPRFTYPIFGDEERIFGYWGLKIHLRFAAHDLVPNIQISYERKFKQVGDTKATDLLETLREWVPQSK